MSDAGDATISADGPLIFISYTTADRDRVNRYCDHLLSNGYNAWVDWRSIKAGQQWRFEITKNLNKASVIVIFISHNSVDKRGYVQRELREALDKAKEKLDEDIYIIPVLLDDDVNLPSTLAEIQCIREANGNSEAALTESIDYQLRRLDQRVEKYQESTSLRWNKSLRKESWEGLPGYDTKVEILTLSSSKYSNLYQINEIIISESIKFFMEQRSVMLDQNSELQNFGQDKFRRTNTLDVTSQDPIVVGKIVTILLDVYQMNGGAAHPYSYTQTLVFLLYPLMRIENLKLIFTNADEAFASLQRSVREYLLSLRFGDDESSFLDPDWVESGTADWADFKDFLFREDGIVILFAPYHVSAYVFGSQRCFVPYSSIVDMIKPVFKSALNIEYINA